MTTENEFRKEQAKAQRKAQETEMSKRFNITIQRIIPQVIKGKTDTVQLVESTIKVCRSPGMNQASGFMIFEEAETGNQHQYPLQQIISMYLEKLESEAAPMLVVPRIIPAN